MKKIFIMFISLLVTVSLLAGCGEKATAVKYDSTISVISQNTGVIATNGSFELSWNNDQKFISLYDKVSGKIWSAIPYEYYLSGETSNNVRSPINITVANAARAEWDTINGYEEVIEKGRLATEKIENGIKITYYFDNYLIAIPVEYVLTEKGLSVSVDSSAIIEDGDKVIMSISIAPFICSASNTSEGSYLFIPSGNGGLMYVDERAEGTRKYTAEVFGEDQSRLLPEEAVESMKIYLPVYGVKDGENALLAVIDEGAEHAEIYAEAGNRRTGYSTVYSTFYLRGYDVVASDQWLWGYRDLNRISDDLIETKIKIDFYPLNGNQADYNGMAQVYRNYLSLSDEKIETGNPLYHLKVLGGVTYRSASWGIPHDELYTMTTFKEAQNIVDTLNEETGAAAVVSLQGFSDKGIDIGKLGGGFTLKNNYGSKKDFKNLLDIGNNTDTVLAFDLDLIRYSKSSSGFSYLWDSAKSATLNTVEKYGINVPLRSYTERGYRLLKRSDLDQAVKKAIDFAEKNSISSVSLSTLGSIAYSDFDEGKYSVKGTISSQVSELIAKMKEKDISICVSDANSYAAKEADILLEVPLDHGNYYVIDEAIPFYQIVFSGVKPMYSGAVNLSENFDKAIMESISTGVRLSFTVVENYDATKCAASKNEKLYGTRFTSVKDSIIDTLSKYEEYYKCIENTAIEKYYMLENGISKTVFRNGTVVYANHSNTEMQTEIGILEAYGVKFVQ